MSGGARGGEPYVFVSYASRDRERVTEIVARLQAAGVPAWIDQHAIDAGTNWGREIAEAIQGCAAFVLMSSEAALASRNVRQEVALAWKYGKPYLPLLLDTTPVPTEIEYWLETAQWVEVLSHPVERWLPRVLDGLARLGIGASYAVEPTRVPEHTIVVPVYEPSVPKSPERFVGRDAEIALLRDALRNAVGEQGHVVLIGGEAGSGKTTLVEALAHEAASDGALVLTGHCYDLSTTPPYGPWIETLRAYPASAGLPPMPATIRDEAGFGQVHSQSAVFDVIARFFRSVGAVTPLVIVMEDLHWADPASLDLLRYVGRQLAGARLLLIGTYRSDELHRRHPLMPVLPALAREAQATRIELSRLNDAAVNRLIAERYGLPDAEQSSLAAYIQDHAEGHALYTAELLRTLEDDGVLARLGDGWTLGDLSSVRVPRLVREVIDARLARLPDETQDSLSIAAVIGHDVPVDLWSAAGELSEDALLDVIDRAVEAHLLTMTPNGTRVRFTHALIREALYDSILPLRRRVRHRRIAEVLEQTQQPDPDAVAHHYLQAGDPRAFDWLIRAGDRAQRAYALEAAAAKLDAAQRLAEHDPARVTDRAWLLYRIGRLHRPTDLTTALAYLEQASVLAAQAGDPILLAFLPFDIGHLIAWKSGSWRGIQQMQASLSALDALSVEAFVSRPGVAQWVADVLPGDDDADHADLHGLQSVADLRRGALVFFLGHAGHVDAALEIGEPFVDRLSHIARSVALESAFNDACVGVGHAYLIRGDVERAAMMWDLAERSADASGSKHGFAQILVWILIEFTLVHDVLDRPARTLAAARIRALLQRANLDAKSSLWLAPLQMLEGEWQALAHAIGPIMEATARTEPIGWKPLLTLTLRQGNVDMTEQQLRHVLPHGTETQPASMDYLSVMAIVSVAVQLELQRGRIAAALDWLEMRERWVAWAGDVRNRADGELLWAAYARATGDADTALARATRALEFAGDPSQPLAILAAQRLLGELATAAGEYETAEAWLGQSLDLATASAAPFERALTLLALAELRVAQDRSQDAREQLMEVRTICELLGARPTLERVTILEAALTAVNS